MKKTLIALLLPTCWGAYAGDMNYTAQVETSYINISSDRGASSTNTSNTFSLKPSLGLTYTANRARASLSAKHTYLDRHISRNSSLSSNQSNNFTDYNFNAQVNAIDKVLLLNARGAQNYQNTSVNNALTNDIVFSDEPLAKTQRGSVGATFTLPNADYFDLVVNGNLSKVESDRSAQDSNSINSDSTSIGAVLRQGDEIKRVSWNITAQHEDTEGKGRNDLESTVVDGSFYVGLVDDWRFVVTGRDEENEFTSDQFILARKIDYSSAGVGLSYYHSSDRFIDVTYNVSSREEDENTDNSDRDKFIGVKFNWRLSSRTSIQGDYGKRFFGRSGSLKLSHRVRKISNSVTYREEVTTYSRLVAGDTVSGTFVCELGAFDPSQCFLPPSPNYVLQPGEQFNDFDFTIPEISEEPRLRKSLTASSGYQFRNLKANLAVSHIDTEFLNSQRSQETLNINLSLSMQLNRKSLLALTNRYSNNDRDRQSGIQGGDNVWSTSLNYNYSVSRNLFTQVGLQYTTRNSPASNRDYSSRRITLSMVYKFQ